MLGLFRIAVAPSQAEKRPDGSRPLGPSGARPPLPAIVARTEIAIEELHHVILKAIGYRAGVRTVVDLKAIGESVIVQDIVQLAGVEPQAVLVADVDRDAAILPQIADVLVNKGQRGIRSPLGQYVLLRHAVLGRQIGIEWRVLGIG